MKLFSKFFSIFIIKKSLKISYFILSKSRSHFKEKKNLFEYLRKASRCELWSVWIDGGGGNEGEWRGVK